MQTFNSIKNIYVKTSFRATQILELRNNTESFTQFINLLRVFFITYGKGIRSLPILF